MPKVSVLKKTWGMTHMLLFHSPPHPIKAMCAAPSHLDPPHSC